MENKNEKSTANGLEESIYEILSTGFFEKSFETLYDYLKSSSKKLGMDQCFYSFDLADVLWKVQLWKQHMPHVRPYYAVKTNSDPTLLRFLSLLGFSFDCASEAEIRMIMEAENEPDKVIFAHVIKTPKAMKYAKSVGVDLMTFDSEEELLKIKECYPTAKLLIRISPEEVKCRFDLSDKYGCDVDETPSLLNIAKNLNLNVVGVCFHVGGLCIGPITYKATIRASRKVFHAANELGFKFNILDIGGGFVGEKGSDTLFIETSQVIHSALEEYFSGVDLEVIAEPGTFFIGSAVSLITAICGKKRRNIKSMANKNDKKDYIERYYYINDGRYGSFFGGVEAYGYKIKPLLKQSELSQRNCLYKSRLWGQTCCSDDLVLEECLLPDMQEGEFLVWENMGAYSSGTCSTFCGQPLPIKKHIFINNNKLNSEWSRNPKIVNFLRKTCSLVGNEF